jgi:hypothetical protein
MCTLYLSVCFSFHCYVMPYRKSAFHWSNCLPNRVTGSVLRMALSRPALLSPTYISAGTTLKRSTVRATCPTTSVSQLPLFNHHNDTIKILLLLRFPTIQVRICIKNPRPLIVLQSEKPRFTPIWTLPDRRESILTPPTNLALPASKLHDKDSSRH